MYEKKHAHPWVELRHKPVIVKGYESSIFKLKIGGGSNICNPPLLFLFRKDQLTLLDFNILKLFEDLTTNKKIRTWMDTWMDTWMETLFLNI